MTKVKPVEERANRRKVTAENPRAAGRPATKDGGKRYNVYLSHAANDDIDALAARLRVSRSEAIEIAARNEARRRKIGV